MESETKIENNVEDPETKHDAEDLVDEESEEQYQEIDDFDNVTQAEFQIDGITQSKVRGEPKAKDIVKKFAFRDPYDEEKVLDPLFTRKTTKNNKI